MAERVPAVLHVGEFAVTAAVVRRMFPDLLERLALLNSKPDCSTDEEG